MWKKLPARYTNITGASSENPEHISNEEIEGFVEAAAKTKGKKRKNSNLDESDHGGEQEGPTTPLPEHAIVNGTLLVSKLVDAQDAEDVAAPIEESIAKPPDSARKLLSAKFKSVHVFKNKDDFLELLVGHSYSNKYSCYHNAVHQCMIHEEFDGSPCDHQFRICERTDDKGEAIYDLQERGFHSTILKLERQRGVHPLMIYDVDEMLMGGIPPSQIVKALKQKYEGQPDMLSLIPKKTKIISRKITAKVKGPQKRTTFAYTPPVSTTVYPPRTPLTSASSTVASSAGPSDHHHHHHVVPASAGGMFDDSFVTIASEYHLGHIHDSGSSSEDEEAPAYPTAVVADASKRSLAAPYVSVTSLSAKTSASLPVTGGDQQSGAGVVSAAVLNNASVYL